MTSACQGMQCRPYSAAQARTRGPCVLTLSGTCLRDGAPSRGKLVGDLSNDAVTGRHLPAFGDTVEVGEARYELTSDRRRAGDLPGVEFAGQHVADLGDAAADADEAPHLGDVGAYLPLDRSPAAVTFRNIRVVTQRNLTLGDAA